MPCTLKHLCLTLGLFSFLNVHAQEIDSEKASAKANAWTAKINERLVEALGQDTLVQSLALTLSPETQLNSKTEPFISGMFDIGFRQTPWSAVPNQKIKVVFGSAGALVNGYPDVMGFSNAFVVGGDDLPIVEMVHYAAARALAHGPWADDQRAVFEELVKDQNFHEMVLSFRHLLNAFGDQLKEHPTSVTPSLNRMLSPDGTINGFRFEMKGLQIQPGITVDSLKLEMTPSQFQLEVEGARIALATEQATDLAETTARFLSELHDGDAQVTEITKDSFKLALAWLHRQLPNVEKKEALTPDH